MTTFARAQQGMSHLADVMLLYMLVVSPTVLKVQDKCLVPLKNPNQVMITTVIWMAES